MKSFIILPPLSFLLRVANYKSGGRTTLNLFDGANYVASYCVVCSKLIVILVLYFLLIDLLGIESPWMVDLQMNFRED